MDGLHVSLLLPSTLSLSFDPPDPQIHMHAPTPSLPSILHAHQRYVLSNLERYKAEDFVPSDEDMLRLHV